MGGLGSGTTTLGRELDKGLNLEFFDTEVFFINLQTLHSKSCIQKMNVIICYLIVLSNLKHGLYQAQYQHGILKTLNLLM